MKYRLINKKTGQTAGIVDEEQKKVTEMHPHTRGKFLFEVINEPAKPAAVKKAKSEK